MADKHWRLPLGHAHHLAASAGGFTFVGGVLLLPPSVADEVRKAFLR